MTNSADEDGSPSVPLEDELLSTDDPRPGFIELNDGTRPPIPVEYAAIDGQAIFEGDIILGTVEQMETLVLADLVNRASTFTLGTTTLALGDDQKDAISNMVSSISGALSQEDLQPYSLRITGDQFRWRDGVIPFDDSGLPSDPRVARAMKHWETKTGIRFKKRTNEKNYVVFKDGRGCRSLVGMKGGPQDIILGACSDRSVIHEIGHAVGLYHEHSREDRDRFVEIKHENIKPGLAWEFIRRVTDGDDVGPYDYDSVMHYTDNAFAKDGTKTIVARGGQAIGTGTGLSAGDISAVRAMYPTIPHP